MHAPMQFSTELLGAPPSTFAWVLRALVTGSGSLFANTHIRQKCPTPKERRNLLPATPKPRVRVHVHRSLKVSSGCQL
jgi:hypothetical protein